MQSEGASLTSSPEDFEVSMFLTETTTRHSLLSKKKHFHEKTPQKMQSNSNRLIAESDQAPIDLEAAQMLREESDDEGSNTRLADIPMAPPREQRKRPKGAQDDEDSMFVSEDDAVEINSDEDEPPHKRVRALGDVGPDDEDDKKKLAMDISYEGFAIYGRVLCLVVQKRESTTQISRKGKGTAVTTKLDGQAKMENWITSTQMPAGDDTS